MDIRNRIFNGDALRVLKALPDDSVHTCVTSPPYYHARDYGFRDWIGGNSNCDHDKNIEHGAHHSGALEHTISSGKGTGVAKGHTATTHSCSKCGSWNGQLGLEPTVDLYVKHVVEIFREVRRVLRADGTLWLNLGDGFSYHARCGVPRKNILFVPSRVALALQADGWIVRMDNIWSKNSTMPESVQDRPTRSHEYIFQLVKSEHYYFDSVAVSEKASTAGVERRNMRSVWTINGKPYRGAHFAVFPPEIPETCIKASTSEYGCCPDCGAPIKRVLKRFRLPKASSNTKYEKGSAAGETARSRQAWRALGLEGPPPPVTVGWTPSCKCFPRRPVPSLVLDPFAGSGTTLMVARDVRRSFIGIEASAEYTKLIVDRLCPPVANDADTTAKVAS